MNTLIVVSNPDPESLSHHIAGRLAQALESVENGRTCEVLDLVATGFNPNFTLEDRAAYIAAGGYPEDVLVEQARVERAQHLVLVFPMYWYGFPGLLKGWIDRVFAYGWAYGSGRLNGLTIHLVPLASGEKDKFERHGYLSAIETLIEHGVVDYCGATRGICEYIWRSETSVESAIESRLNEIIDTLMSNIAESTEGQVLTESLDR